MKLRTACDAVCDFADMVAETALADLVHHARRAVLVERHPDMGPPSAELLDALMAAALAIPTGAGERRWALRRAAEGYVLWARTEVPVAAGARRIQRGAEKIAEARAMGFTGKACPGCGGFTVLMKGTCEGCSQCPWQGGCG